jgi:hypothetical protein
MLDTPLDDEEKARYRKGFALLNTVVAGRPRKRRTLDARSQASHKKFLAWKRERKQRWESGNVR